MVKQIINIVCIPILYNILEEIKDNLSFKVVNFNNEDECLKSINDNKSQIYFSKMQQLVRKLQLKDISMGMSNDYLEAINYQSTYLRIGSKIFGERN